MSALGGKEVSGAKVACGDWGEEKREVMLQEQNPPQSGTIDIHTWTETFTLLAFETTTPDISLKSQCSFHHGVEFTEGLGGRTVSPDLTEIHLF